MTSILLIYPFFKSRHDRSIFRFPPLGIGYLASSLRKSGYDPKLLDCTFLDKEKALEMAIETKAEVVGIYSMVTMREQSLMFARHLRETCDTLIAGGPLPSCDPASFLNDFDVVVIGEGEKAICEILRAYEEGLDLGSIEGIAYRQDGRDCFTPEREFESDLDRIAFPARDLFPNKTYVDYWKRRFGYAITTVMTTRGCPFRCEFCSNAVFGVSYRERSPENSWTRSKRLYPLGMTGFILPMTSLRLTGNECCACVTKSHPEILTSSGSVLEEWNPSTAKLPLP